MNLNYITINLHWNKTLKNCLVTWYISLSKQKRTPEKGGKKIKCHVFGFVSFHSENLWLYEGFYYASSCLPGLMQMQAHFNARSSNALIISFLNLVCSAITRWTSLWSLIKDIIFFNMIKLNVAHNTRKIAVRIFFFGGEELGKSFIYLQNCNKCRAIIHFLFQL